MQAIARMKKALQFEKLKKDEKARVLEEERSKAKEREIIQSQKRTKLVVVATCKSGFSSNQSLSHATNEVKKELPMSPRKKREVIKSHSKQFNILKKEVAYQKSRLIAFAPVFELDKQS